MDYEQLQREFQAEVVTAFVAAADDHSSTALSLIAARSGYRLRIQKIVIAVTTVAAQTQTLQSTATGGSPANYVVAALAQSAPLGPTNWDYGTKGLIMPDGLGLEFVNEAAGVACVIHVQAYWEPIPQNYLS